ncbi:MAG TPA: hypothetical protein ENG77_05590 [Chromatiales bacterium]|nr:hypothetical protein [Chromatiales bacterium]
MHRDPERAPHLLAALSHHGHGHLAQCAPVFNALRRRIPRLRLTVYSALPRSVLAARLDGPFRHWEAPADVGMVMEGSLVVRAAASVRAYAAFHGRWEAGVAHEADRLAELAPDAVVADVPYRILEAAARTGVPAAALCSLHWGEIYRAYCGAADGAAAILAQIEAAYRCARVFLAPEPALSMAGLPNRVAIGPIARLGRDRREVVRRRAGLDVHGAQRLILVAPGGIPTPLPVADWPARPGLRWLVPPESAVPRPDVIPVTTLGEAFIDVLCAGDAVITKPGYGIFTEAACNGVPVLYVRRGDWPEEPGLIAWLRRHGRAREITGGQLRAGDLQTELRALWAAPAPVPPLPTGIEQAATRIEALLRSDDPDGE